VTQFGTPRRSHHPLEPEDWEELRRLGHRVMDDIVDDLSRLREQPVWRPVPDSARTALRGGVPLQPAGLEAAYAEFRRHVMPYPRGNNHPRFWGWVNGSGLPAGIIADLLAAAMNSSIGTFDCAPILVEAQVLGWLKEMLGFPPTASAVLTSGCSMSNVIGLAVARSAMAPFDVRRLGVASAPRPPTLYGSTEVHGSIQKAVELLGLGGDSLRAIPTGTDYRIRIDELKHGIQQDRRGGRQPMCVVANAGTVNTGAVDELEALADLCAQEHLWLHVDGAFGALAWLCPEGRALLRGLQRADSLAFDLHKWMYLPYDVGCVVVADGDLHQRTFALRPAYLSAEPDASSHLHHFADRGLELSRRFRALKVWLALKEHGLGRFAEQIGQNIDQARYLAAMVARHPDLELMAPVSLNVVCFRYVSGGLGEEVLDRLNRELLTRLQTGGVALPSHAVLKGRFVLRAAITNHRSRYEDFDLLLDEVVRHGQELRGTVHPFSLTGRGRPL
jgi:glutamate/tyrosine decarboxylase-like PLP-dependent enzyme